MGSSIKVYAIEGILFRRIKCLRSGNRTEMVSQIKVFAIDGIHFTRMNCLQLATTN